MIVKNIKTSKKDREIDDEVVGVAHDQTFWDKEAHAKPKSKPTSIRFSTRTIERAKFFAKIHGERGYQSWIKKIVEERVATEYELYRRLKREVV